MTTATATLECALGHGVNWTATRTCADCRQAYWREVRRRSRMRREIAVVKVGDPKVYTTLEAGAIGRLRRGCRA